eukprot:11185159-Lingulodinium_polyedra.AAC.1
MVCAARLRPVGRLAPDLDFGGSPRGRLQIDRCARCVRVAANSRKSFNGVGLSQASRKAVPVARHP